MTANSTRGEREVDLGSLGKVVCRPSLRSLEALDSDALGGPLPDLLRRLGLKQSLRDTINVIYEMHIDGLPDGAPALTREQIGNAVVEIGFNRFHDDCYFLVQSAWHVPKKPSEADRPGSSEDGGVGEPEKP